LEQQLAFEETCERYLLGELSEAEREQFEEAYFADDALFERFLAGLFHKGTLLRRTGISLSASFHNSKNFSYSDLSFVALAFPSWASG
jgi:hypothetical protein